MKTKTQTVASHPILSLMWMENNRLPSSKVPLYSREKAWWECQICHYQFERGVVYQARQNGQCPRCLLSKQNKAKHLGLTHPEVAKTLIHEKNKGWEAIHLTASSNRKLWWRCPTCHRPFETRVSERIKTNRCAYCARRKVSTLNALASNNPELAKEWHPTLNGDVHPHEVAVNSNRVFWWKCSYCGHSWKSACKTRNLQQTKCPACEKKRRSTLEFYLQKNQEKSLFARCPEISQQWHPFKNQPLQPSEIGPYTQKKVWWHCEACGHDWLESVIKRTRTIKGRACPSCEKNSFIAKEGKREDC